MDLRYTVAAVLLVLLSVHSVSAQEQSTVTTPQLSITDGFSESMGIGFGVSGPGFFFNNGVNGPAVPFGPVPGLASFGGSARLGALNFRWNLFAGQSSHRSLSMAAPSLTMMNGSSGFFASGSVRPFVTGIVPVVGGHSVSPIDLGLERLSASGGLERAIRERRAERRRAEEAEDRQPAKALPPLPEDDDPPLILDGN